MPTDDKVCPEGDAIFCGLRGLAEYKKLDDESDKLLLMAWLLFLANQEDLLEDDDAD